MDKLATGGGLDTEAVARALEDQAAGGSKEQPAQGDGKGPEGGAAGGKQPEGGKGPEGQPKGDQKEKPREGESAGDGQKSPDDLPIGEDFKLDVKDADPDLAAAFTGVARELGLTPKQARSLANWQMERFQQARDGMVAAGVKALNAEWGASAAGRQKDVMAMIARVDRELEAANPKLGAGSFSKAIEAFGVDCHPDFVRGLAHLAGLLAEDSIGASGGASAGQAEESVLEGLRDAMNSYRKK